MTIIYECMVKTLTFVEQVNNFILSSSEPHKSCEMCREGIFNSIDKEAVVQRV